MSSSNRGARSALALLLLINLFNYIDRYVLAAVVMVMYMLSAPVFARLAERKSRWMLVGIGVILWSLASGASGLAATFLLSLIHISEPTRLGMISYAVFCLKKK